jgi:hypothetical protein
LVVHLQPEIGRHPWTQIPSRRSIGMVCRTPADQHLAERRQLASTDRPLAPRIPLVTNRLLATALQCTTVGAVPSEYFGCAA